jgi:hypothetical protein
MLYFNYRCIVEKYGISGGFQAEPEFQLAIVNCTIKGEAPPSSFFFNFIFFFFLTFSFLTFSFLTLSGTVDLFEPVRDDSSRYWDFASSSKYAAGTCCARTWPCHHKMVVTSPKKLLNRHNGIRGERKFVESISAIGQSVTADLERMCSAAISSDAGPRP